MKSNLMILGVLVALIAAPAARAQSPAGASPVWNVPFDFVVGDHTLPAGEYTVRNGATSGIVLIQSLDGRASQFRFANPILGGKYPEHSTLVFHRYGNQHFLAQVWMAGRDDGRELNKSRIEREIARRAPAVENIAMAAK